MTTQPQPTPKRIAVLTCSSRKPRLNPYITTFIISTIQSLLPSSTTVTLEHIDLGSPTYFLPLDMDEPLVPAQLPASNPTPHYTQPHTRRWSETIKSASAIIFVTPQYNWSVPATLKNALDYLYHEWTGKPAMIVSYGGKRGGSKVSEHLVQVLGGGLKMRLVETRVGLPCDEDLIERCRGEGRVDGRQVGAWEERGLVEEVRRGWRELEVMLVDGK